jgi:hypothetical protein
MIHCVTLINFESSDMVLKRLENELILKNIADQSPHLDVCYVMAGRVIWTYFRMFTYFSDFYYKK